MTDPHFEESPHLGFLRYLSKGSLKQDLVRSLRLWALLRFLYDWEGSFPDNSFTLAGWSDVFFHPAHPRQDTGKRACVPDCACRKTVAGWVSGHDEGRWQDSIAPYLGSRSMADFWREPLFSVTRRTLQYDFDYLVTLGWLYREGKNYRKVGRFPEYPRLSLDRTGAALPLVNEELQAIASNLSDPLGGYPRFFIDVDYIVSNNYIDQVEDRQEELKTIWQQEVIPPLRLSYRSVHYGNLTRVVYPVCLYYHRRAIYLCAFGQSPREDCRWYNYRLDKIADLAEISWKSPEIPEDLRLAYRGLSLPSPDDVRELMGKAWGFDFYLPAKLLLVRFARSFHDHYIQDTYRHDTFRRISRTEAIDLIRPQDPAGNLLAIVDSRPSDDVYYRALHREGDINVLHRLYSWRPHIEIFLPVKLRQDIASMVRKEGEYYR